MMCIQDCGGWNWAIQPWWAYIIYVSFRSWQSIWFLSKFPWVVSTLLHKLHCQYNIWSSTALLVTFSDIIFGMCPLTPEAWLIWCTSTELQDLSARWPSKPLICNLCCCWSCFLSISGWTFTQHAYDHFQSWILLACPSLLSWLPL